MEDAVLERMRTVIGWKAGTGDGIFAPGWRIYTMSVTYAHVTCSLRSFSL